MPPSTAADSDAIVAAASPSAAVKNKGYKLRQAYFLPVLKKKLRTEKKLAPQKTQCKFLQKKLKVPESPQYFSQKTQDFFTIRDLF